MGDYKYTMDRILDESNQKAKQEFHRYIGQRQRESSIKSDRIEELEEGLRSIKKQLIAFYAREQAREGKHKPGDHFNTTIDNIKETIDDILRER